MKHRAGSEPVPSKIFTPADGTIATSTFLHALFFLPSSNHLTLSSMKTPKTLIFMGVSGCGKSFIGAKVAQALGCVFEDGDDFHPVSNIDKMAGGTPLTDDDRAPWLDILRDRIVLNQSLTDCYVLACSALKQSYRDRLRGNDSLETLVFIYLEGSKELIRQRMEARDHFMPPALLDSQFATLEKPGDAIAINIELTTPDEMVDTILQHF
jgi:gluconokinase